MNKILSALLVLVFLSSGSTVLAEEGGTRYSDQLTSGVLEPITSFKQKSLYHAIFDGRYVYLDHPVDGITILDTIDPTHMVEVGSIPFQDFMCCPLLAVTDNILYLNSIGDGILIYDVSDPTSPAEIGKFEPVDGMNFSGLWISGTQAYTSDSTLGFVILDITDPAHPTLLGTNAEELQGFISQLVIQGQYAYALSGSRLIIYDISDPTQPVLLSHYDRPSREWYFLAVSGNVAYLSGIIRDDQWEVAGGYTDAIDISNPSEPEWVAEVPQLAIPIKQLTAKDGLLYAVRYDGLALYDLSDPLEPRLMSLFPSGRSMFVELIGSRALYADDITGLHILETSDPNHLVQAGYSGWPQSAQYLTSLGTNVYSVVNYWVEYPTFEWRSVLRVIDASNPYDAWVIGYLHLNGETLGKPFLDWPWIYVPTTLGVEIVDATNPSNLRKIGRAEANNSFTVEVLDHKLYAYSRDAGYMGSLSIYDVSNPVSPTLLGNSPVYNTTQAMSISQQGENTFAYLISGGKLVILDVTDPANPIEVPREPLDEEYTLVDTESQGSKTIAFLSGRNSFSQTVGIIAMDVSDPGNPAYLGEYPIFQIDQAAVLEAMDGIVYFSDYAYQNTGLRLLDFSDPVHPNQFATAIGSILDASVGAEFIYTTPWGQISVYQKISDIRGFVTDHNYKPISGVTLTLNTGAETLTGADGSYLFSKLDSGQYVVTPTLDSFVFYPTYREVSLPSDWNTQNFVILPPPTSAVLSPGITTTLTYTDVQGLPTSFIFPSGLVSSTAIAQITPTLASGFFGTDFAGHAFYVGIDMEGPDAPDELLTRPVSVTIQYNLDDTAVISDTAKLGLYRHNGSGWEAGDAGCPPEGAMPVQEPGIFRGRLCQEGLYALFGPTYSIAIPMIISGGIDTVCEPPGCPPLSTDIEE